MLRPIPSGWIKKDWLLTQQGPYFFKKWIGRGGFAEVYLVEIEREGSKHERALKVLFEERFANNLKAKPVERFKQEYALLDGLEHPGVIRAFAHGFSHELRRHYIELEYVFSPSLEQYVQKYDALSPWETCNLGVGLADVLSYLHDETKRGAKAIIHRDINPSNVLVAQSGKGCIPKLLDFGLARDLRNLDPGTQAGTYLYQAPEQFVSTEEHDPRLDLYQLGAVLHFALTQQPPYPAGGKTIPELQRERQGSLGPKPSQHRAELAQLAPDLDDLVSRLLSTDPNKRPRSAPEVLRLLLSLRRRLDPVLPSVRPSCDVWPSVSAERDIPNHLTLLSTDIPLLAPVHVDVSAAQAPNHSAKTKDNIMNISKPLLFSELYVHKRQTSVEKIQYKPDLIFTEIEITTKNQKKSQVIKFIYNSFRIIQNKLMDGCSKFLSLSSKLDEKFPLWATALFFVSVLLIIFVFYQALNDYNFDQENIDVIHEVSLKYPAIEVHEPKIIDSIPINNVKAVVPKITPSVPDPNGAEPKMRHPGMVYVSAGKFVRGSDSGDPDEKPVREIYLSEYWIDAYEVTVDQYRACVEAGICSEPDTFCGDSYNNWVQNRGNHPVNCVSWTQASAYCRWAWKRLPTEAQWEKAARGTDGRTYPWGEQEPTCDYAVMNDGGWACGRDMTWPVGSKSKGVSPYGAYDMSGNVREWVFDWYPEDAYWSAPESDPEGPGVGLKRVARGGSFTDSDVSRLRAANRLRDKPDYVGYALGFRCAK